MTDDGLERLMVAMIEQAAMDIYLDLEYGMGTKYADDAREFLDSSFYDDIMDQFPKLNRDAVRSRILAGTSHIKDCGAERWTP